MRHALDSRDAVVSQIKEDLKERLVSLNQKAMDEIQMHIDAALENIVKGVSYRYISEQGLRLPVVTVNDPLLDRYLLEY